MKKQSDSFYKMVIVVGGIGIAVALFLIWNGHEVDMNTKLLFFMIPGFVISFGMLYGKNK